MIALFRALLLLAVVVAISHMASGLRSQAQNSAPFKPGDTVQVLFDGAWWDAKVHSHVVAGTRISYDVGKDETIPPADLSIRIRNGSENKTQPNVYAIDSRVEGNFEGKGGFYPGTIAAVHGDSTYDIHYDDGDIEVHVCENFIRMSRSNHGQKRSLPHDTPVDTAPKKLSTPTTRFNVRWLPSPVRHNESSSARL